MRRLMANNRVALPAIIVTLLSALLLAETSWSSKRHSLTYDETIYLNLALQSVREHRLDPEAMRLGVAPLPGLLTYALPLWLSAPDEPRRASTQAGRVKDAQLIRAPRFLNALLIGVPLVIVVFVWLYRRRGLAAAVLGGSLTALSPTILAHGSLATTDEGLALFSTLALAAIAWFATAPGMTRFVLCAAAIAAAMSAKYSAVYLLPVAASVLFLSALRREREQHGRIWVVRPMGRSAFQSAALVCLVLPLWWAGHGFARATPEQVADPDSIARPSSPSSNSVRTFVLSLAPTIGIQRQIIHSREGDAAFLMGERSNAGWWYYFPLMFLFKSTPAELALALFLIVAIAAHARHPLQAIITSDSTLQCLFAAAIVFGALLMLSHLDLGHRYMIPMYPILIIAGCDLVVGRLQTRPLLLRAGAAALVATQAWSSFTIAPHYLPYANSLAGGPGNAWRLMADSSVDWGQDLPDLRAYLDAHDRGPVAMKYFGTALPEAYGVVADDIEHLHKRPEEYGLFAVSATYLDGLHLGGRDPFKPFRQVEPAAQVGYSIMVYDLRRPDALSALREALKVIH